jgi:hypothetical protein
MIQDLDQNAVEISQVQHAQDLVDEAVDESFPASDPPATHRDDNPPANAPAKWRSARLAERDDTRS